MPFISFLIKTSWRMRFLASVFWGCRGIIPKTLNIFIRLGFFWRRDLVALYRISSKFSCFCSTNVKSKYICSRNWLLEYENQGDAPLRSQVQSRAVVESRNNKRSDRVRTVRECVYKIQYYSFLTKTNCRKWSPRPKVVVDLVFQGESNDEKLA